MPRSSPEEPGESEDWSYWSSDLSVGSVMFSALMYDMNADEIDEDIELRRRAEKRRITPGFALPKKRKRKRKR